MTDLLQNITVFCFGLLLLGLWCVVKRILVIQRHTNDLLGKIIDAVEPSDPTDQALAHAEQSLNSKETK